jgi:hypothetical protein
MNHYITKISYDEKQQILVPFASLIRLILLYYMPEHTKISILNNRIYYQTPGIMQGIFRWYNGDKGAHLHNVNTAINKSIDWYNSKNRIIYNIFLETIIGLECLKEQYKDTKIIQHSIILYIKNITDELNIPSTEMDSKSLFKLKICDNDNNLTIENKLFNLWSEEEIKLIHDMIEILKKTNFNNVNYSNNHMINSIIKILDGKDEEAHNIIINYTSSL